jgi:hypothetical protein
MRKAHQKYFYAIVIAIPLLFIVAAVLAYGTLSALEYKDKIDLRIEGDWPLAGDRDIGFTPAKNSSTLRSHVHSNLRYHLFVDNRGARVTARGQQTPSRAALVTVGGSFSWGHGMENEQTFTEILGRKLRIPVANFAYGSYGTVQSLQLLERNADLRPRVIVYGFITAHLKRNLSPCAPSYAPFCLPVAYVDFDEGGDPYIHAPVAEYDPDFGQKFFAQVVYDSFGVEDVVWGLRVRATKMKKKYLRFKYKHVLKQLGNKASHTESMKYLIRRMHRVAERIGATLIVVHIPYLDRGHTNPPPSGLTDALDPDTVLIDMAPVVERYYENMANPSLRFERDGHPNPVAHELIADAIHRALKERQIL